MTLEEALQELGIERSASPDEARRAYLRGIKTRKPETDPEGFRRLREAYELAAGLLKEQPAPEPAETAGDEDKDWEEKNAPPELTDLAARLSGLPPETYMEERLALLRQAVREHPASPGVRWWLVQELSQTGLQQEMLSVLRAGDAAGFPGFLETRAARFPDSVDAADLARLESSDDLDTLSMTAQVYLHRSQPREAVAALSRVIDRLRKHEDPATRPLPSWLPRMLLAVEAAGLTLEARGLHDRFWQWLSGTGDAGLLQSWGAIHWWKVAHEIGQLHPTFPHPLRQAAALAALTGEAEPAEEKAKRFAKARPQQAEHFSTMLYDLPMLYSLYYRPLQGISLDARPQRQEEAVSSPGVGIAVRLVISALIFAGLALADRCPSVGAGLRRLRPSSYRFEAPKSEALQKEASSVWRVLDGLCNESPLSLPSDDCKEARRAVDAMRNGDCLGTRTALDRLERIVARSGPMASNNIVSFEQQAFSALASACGPYELRP